MKDPSWIFWWEWTLFIQWNNLITNKFFTNFYSVWNLYFKDVNNSEYFFPKLKYDYLWIYLLNSNKNKIELPNLKFLNVHFKNYSIPKKECSKKFINSIVASHTVDI
jgi:hypothetical protein